MKKRILNARQVKALNEVTKEPVSDFAALKLSPLETGRIIHEWLEAQLHKKPAPIDERYWNKVQRAQDELPLSLVTNRDKQRLSIITGAISVLDDEQAKFRDALHRIAFRPRCNAKAVAREALGIRQPDLCSLLPVFVVCQNDAIRALCFSRDDAEAFINDNPHMAPLRIEEHVVK